MALLSDMWLLSVRNSGMVLVLHKLKYQASQVIEQILDQEGFSYLDQCTENGFSGLETEQHVQLTLVFLLLHRSQLL